MYLKKKKMKNKENDTGEGSITRQGDRNPTGHHLNPTATAVVATTENWEWERRERKQEEKKKQGRELPRLPSDWDLTVNLENRLKPTRLGAKTAAAVAGNYAGRTPAENEKKEKKKRKKKEEIKEKKMRKKENT